ncbi:hypothetical protein [Rathayibacter sp. VKM Ac-2630]|uniref:hypothetical protein n=1 Tax=Rathayibacter sp. VKM Ac-2630 TaxID=1938617 RepID=UPI0009818465|nr:hypothetical protein [Rathayibacter sp. VKM Ac-2630]OOB90876.1 hypothetical protein B0T42_09010 [Rathayibacter sp. VKM Ac-2630]
MDEAPRRPARGWWIDLDEPPAVPSDEATAAVAHAAEAMARLGGSIGSGAEESATAILRAAADRGADEHALAVATGLVLDEVRSLLRRA